MLQGAVADPFGHMWLVGKILEYEFEFQSGWCCGEERNHGEKAGEFCFRGSIWLQFEAWLDSIRNRF